MKTNFQNFCAHRHTGWASHIAHRLNSILIVRFVLIVAALFSIANLNIHAQDCSLSNCADTSWHYNTQSFPLSWWLPSWCPSPSCTAVITYKYRAGCGQCEFNISRIEYPGPPSCNCPSTDIITASILAVLFTGGDPACAPQVAGECITNVRVYVGACWRHEVNLVTGNDIYSSCTGSPCCWAEYKLCRDGNSAPYIEKTGNGSTAFSCQEEINVQESGCFLFCGFLPETYAGGNNRRKDPEIGQRLLPMKRE